ncbi:hypothetical protein BO94DRAFT_490840 [Aspergillus sclerotioniger CBS 115572]|uniref:Rhodopsin domain-containing protein n=1 Tax=Aspergillus sclerotioniger CBS 115572 TaxID=1450535 RepID=A0A317WUD4_9EURO|nr:hypothetical protein BO94DRAFT_490840 [Aspergillus sclerotioniger CBS 115572]PWY89685.1 hypothetical protein BO94DRAFT_490840 [Aspergillus sclerotioniger CBS 115572]
MPQISAAIQAAEAEGRIPPGISLEYLAQSRDRPTKIAILFVGALTCLIVIARCYARVFLVKKFGWDDALAVFTLSLYISIVALSIFLIDLGSGRHIEYIEYVLSLTQVDKTEVYDFVMHILYTAALFVCRLSGLAFYQRLASRHPKISLAIKLSAGFLVAAFLTQFFLLLFHCLPVTGLWPYAWQPQIDDYNCISWGDVYVANSVLSLVCDMMMLTLPSMLIYMLQVSQKRKIQLSLVMFPGVLVLIISCVRMYLVIIGQWSSDGSWAYDPMLAIETSEVGGTLIALSIPAMKSLFGSWFSHLKAYSSRAGTSRKQSGAAHRAYGRSWETGVKLNSLGNNTVDDAYKVNIGAEPITHMPTSDGHQRSGNDGSSEDLLMDAGFDRQLALKHGIRLTEEVSVSSSRASGLQQLRR